MPTHGFRFVSAVLAVAAWFASLPFPATGQDLRTSHRSFLLDPDMPFEGPIAVGDFDGDGRDDLAVSEAFNLPDSSTRVALYLARGNGFAFESIVGPGGGQRPTALAAGKFFGGDTDILAVGVPGKTVGATTGAGVVEIYYWSGPTFSFLILDLLAEGAGLGGFPSTGAACGSSLTVGDFDDDGYEDLAIGCPGEPVAGHPKAGMVHVVHGSAMGLDADQVFTQATTSVIGDPDNDEQFGYSLAADDFDADGFDDLAVGIFQDVVNGKLDAGSVQVLFGTASGLSAAGNQLLNRDTAGVEGVAVEEERFGFALATGNLDTDLVGGGRELIVGVLDDPGSVHVFYGAAAGLGTGDDEIWTAAAVDLEGVDQVRNCGSAVAAGRFTAGPWDSLVMSCPLSNLPGALGAGMLVALPGTASGVVATGGAMMTAGGTAAAPPTQGDWFGSWLGVGDFDADGTEDLAVSFRDGQVQVFVSTLFFDGFESGDTNGWSSSSP